MSMSNTTKRVKEIRRKTRRKFSSEEKIRIVLEGLRGECSIAELCRRGWTGPRAAALAAKIPVVQGSPESHLRSETTPPILVGMPEKAVNNPYTHSGTIL
jgi:hypothetical protein